MDEAKLNRRKIVNLDFVRLRLDKLAHVLDNAILIPGTRYRFGIDSLIGLVPGIGDVIAGAISSYILIEAVRIGAPLSLIFRMSLNIAIDTLFGSIPFLGDAFDFFYKSNLQNVKLLTNYIEDPQRSTIGNRLFSFAVVLLIIALLAAVVYGIYKIGTKLF